MATNGTRVDALSTGDLFRTRVTNRWGRVVRDSGDAVTVRLGSTLVELAGAPEREVHPGLVVTPVGN